MNDYDRNIGLKECHGCVMEPFKDGADPLKWGCVKR